MTESDDIMQEYIKKVLKIQQEQRNRPPDETEMKKIAEELGMSADDIAYVQKKLRDYIARGQGYSRYEDWDSAIDEFMQAVAIGPYNVEALFGLANAYKNRWLLKHNKNDLLYAKDYVKKALQIDADHDPSFRLASELNKGTAKYTTNSQTFTKYNDFNLNTYIEKLEAETIQFDGNKRLKKSARDKKIFGVCAGIAEYFGIDPTWIRIIFILGIFVTGISPLVYIILAFILPKN